MDPALGPSTTLDSGRVDLILGSSTEDCIKEGKLSWDAHAYEIVLGLTFFGCKVRYIDSTLKSYGFICSLRALIQCVNRYKMVKYDKIRNDAHGSFIIGSNFSGMELNTTFIFVNGKAMSMTHEYKLLRARAPLYESFICSHDGREIIVELTDGQIQIRVLEHPDPEREASLVAQRAALQTYSGPLQFVDSMISGLS